MLSMHCHIHMRIFLLINIFTILIHEIEIPPAAILMGYILGVRPLLVRNGCDHGLLAPCVWRHLACHLRCIASRFRLHNWNHRRVCRRLKSIVAEEAHRSMSGSLLHLTERVFTITVDEVGIRLHRRGCLIGFGTSGILGWRLSECSRRMVHGW